MNELKTYKLLTSLSIPYPTIIIKARSNYIDSGLLIFNGIDGSKRNYMVHTNHVMSVEEIDDDAE